jgi:UDP-glucose 4-epimerase
MAGESTGALAELPVFLQSADIDAVLHLAWSTVPATAEQKPDSEQKTDLALLSKIVAALDAVPAEKRPLLVFFSTGAVYGESKEGAEPFTEMDAVRPLGAYGKGKVAAEALLTAAGAEGLPAAILRVTNVYGMADLTGVPQGVIPAIARAAEEGCPFEIWGSGEAVKDYLHVRDLAEALEAVVSKRLSGIFNVASGETICLHAILQMAQVHLGKTIATTKRSAPAWDVQHARYSSTKLRVAAGWTPQVRFAEGLAETLNSCLSARGDSR